MPRRSLARPGPDYDGIDLFGIQSRLLQRLGRSLGCQRRGVPEESSVQRVRRQIKRLAQRVQRQAPRGNAVVAQQDLFQDGLRTAGKSGKLPGDLQRLPAFPLLVAPLGCGRAQSGDKHDSA